MTQLEENKMLANTISFSDMRLISHSLGIDLFKAVMSLKLKDKKLPRTFYRNYYNASKRQAEIAGIPSLIDKGILKQIQPEYYSVSDKGIAIFKQRFYQMAIYKPKKSFDIDYLKHRINFYCSFYNYKFCDDNSNHVLEYAAKLLINKEYVSHTTKDVILRFKTELKKLIKNQAIAPALNL